MTCRDIHLHRVCEMSPAHPEFRVIMVPGRDDLKVKKRLIILFPLNYTTRSPFGRATRAMLAFDVEARDIVFLKDYWRASVICRLFIEHNHNAIQ